MVCCSNVHKALLVFSQCILNSFIKHKSPMGIQKNGISTYASIFFPKFLQSFLFPLGITQKIKIKINKQRTFFCAMVSGQGISNIMGFQPPILGACYFETAPNLGHYPTQNVPSQNLSISFSMLIFSYFFGFQFAL